MRTMFAKAAALLCGLLVGLGVTEGVVRILFPHTRDIVIPGRLFMMDEDLGWKLAASKASRHRTRYFDVQYATNSLGFRDKPRAVPKTRGKHRVLLYGDSLIFGWGLSAGERFSDLLENEAPGLEVWNQGVPGWGLDQEILLYEQEGGRMAADDAMFFVADSTMSRIHTGYIYAKYKPMFIQEAGGGLREVRPPKGKEAMMSFVYQMFSPFYLPYFVQNRIERLQRLISPADAGPSSIESVRYINGFSAALLRYAWKTVQERHQQMTVLIADLSQADRSELKGLCLEAGITCLEIAPEISALSTTPDSSDLIFGQYDKHWNAKANRLIASQLWSQMKPGLP